MIPKKEREVAYGVDEIAHVIDLVDDAGNPKRRKTYHMLERGYVDGAKKKGNIWTLSILIYRRSMHGDAA